MNIGIPNETSAEERRLAVTPLGVNALSREGHTIYFERSAGISCGFPNQAFRDAGAEVVFSTDEVFHRSELIVKVQPPTLAESELLQSGQLLFSFLNVGGDRKASLDKLMQHDVTAFAYEFVKGADGRASILSAMSEIAGLLMPQIAGRYLESEQGGRGITLPGVGGVPPANVVIFGAGAVGVTAARAFKAIGTQVLVLDQDVDKLRMLDLLLNKQVATALVTPIMVERAVRFADVVVGAVHIWGERAPHVISEDLVKLMKPGSVILDVSIDQGGCVETSRPTSLSAPVFRKHGVTHYCVPNLTSSVARSASYALNNAVLPWLLELGYHGPEAIFARNAALRNGTYLFRGGCTSRVVAEIFDFDLIELPGL